jgi:hypothetical protein
MDSPYYPITTNEPVVHPIIKRSFAFVPTAGMRLSPEILVIELMREVFYESHYENSFSKDLNPEETDDKNLNIYSDAERAILHVLRGRRKKTSQRFFAPAYPQLARNSWLGKKRERVIYNFLLSGPIVQNLWSKGETSVDGKAKQEELVEEIWRALIGTKSDLENGYNDKEILAVALGLDSFNLDKNIAIGNLKEKTSWGESEPMVNVNDTIADRITLDFKTICRLESTLPRMQWIQTLMTFLRFVTPMWLLSQMQISRLLHSWIIDAMDKGKIPDQEIIITKLLNRNQGLLHPALTPTRELFEHIEQYMKCRVEINILLHVLESINKEQLKKKKLKLTSGGSEDLSIENLLIIARDSTNAFKALDHFKKIANNQDIRTFLIREGEQHAAWRNPLLKGQGKNIDEFFRVLYRAEVGDEAGGYLLTPEGRGVKRGFRVFPGQLLLKTIIYLAAKEKMRNNNHGGSGKLILQDVEDHFAQYGIDFTMAADARPILMKEIQAMGLLIGSPDAGSSVAVYCPY